jgi:hypothetical protein
MTLDEYVAELDRLDRDATALAGSLTDAQANWQPEGGRRWSVTQNLQHLAKTNEIYTGALRTALTRAAAVEASRLDLSTVPGWFGRWFIRMMEPPPRFRLRTRRVVQPPSTGPVKDALDAFLASHRTVRELAREAARRDLRATFTSPFGPVRFSIATGLLTLAAHDRRHLWQARQVLAAEGYPGG